MIKNGFYLVVSNIFYFHPENWGRWTHFDEHIFQMGWFNHQLHYWPWTMVINPRIRVDLEDPCKSTNSRNRQEDPAEDLGPDPTWHRVHSTPAGSQQQWRKTTGCLHSLKLTYPLKMVVFNRNLLFQGSILRGYVSFREGRFVCANWTITTSEVCKLKNCCKKVLGFISNTWSMENNLLFRLYKGLYYNLCYRAYCQRKFRLRNFRYTNDISVKLSQLE